MSIPKEPRQLMINLMYIVLTALLALNVSAEIIEAFFTMDKSIQESNAIVGNTNDKLLAALSTQANAYEQYLPLQEKATEAQKITKDFIQYVDDLKDEIIEASGGLDEKNQPKGKLDKDITTRLLVKEDRGNQLQEKIESTKTDLLQLIEEEEHRSQMAEKIPLKIQDLPEDSDKKSWAAFSFQQMPVAAILPMFSKLQNDVKVAETAILNYFLEQTNSTVKPDSYIPVVASDKSYVISGEQYEAELFLAAYSSTADNLFVKVDGQRIPIRNGKAVFKRNPNRLGEHNHELLVGMTDPITGETKTFKKKFSYEVGERSVTVSADKMNVLYVGVENPISVSAAGIPSSKMQVNASGTKLTKVANGQYIAKPERIGEAKITISGGDLVPTTKTYRVKKIPNPILKLGGKTGGTMSAAEFKVHKGIIPHLENFDFNAKCQVVGFELTRQPKNDDVIVEINKSGAYQANTKRLVDRAKPTDIYYFDNIRVKCPGDEVTRKLNGMIFRIK